MPILNREAMPSNHTKHHLPLTNSLKQYPHKMTASRRTTDKMSRQQSPTKRPPFAGRLRKTGNQTYVPTVPTLPTREWRLCTVWKQHQPNTGGCSLNCLRLATPHNRFFCSECERFPVSRLPTTLSQGPWLAVVLALEGHISRTPDALAMYKQIQAVRRWAAP